MVIQVADGLAHGPCHQPAPTREKNNGALTRYVTLAAWTKWNNGFPPSSWPTACGEEGWLYADVPFVTDSRGACQACAAALMDVAA